MAGSEADEGLDQVSADLPHQLQFEMFKEITTIATAGAGVAIAMAGALPGGFNIGTWMAVVWFALTAILCLVAQVTAADKLFARKPHRRQMRTFALIAVMMIGMGVGALGTGVYISQHQRSAAPAAAN